MEIELVSVLQGQRQKQWVRLLHDCGLQADADVERTVLVWDQDRLAATGSRQGNLLKCIGVEGSRQGEGLTATVLTQLRQDAFRQGIDHLFLYTKPRNRQMFEPLFFYPVAQTEQVLLMENRKDGIQTFLAGLESGGIGGKVGAAVMNCNPFTLGHRHLIETAARECDWVYVFVVSEERSLFSAANRLAMVQAGTADLENVTVLPTGPYLISSATFPTYFLPDREQAEQIHFELDLELFLRYFVPRFGITHRYVGTEPFSKVTDSYHTAMGAKLPRHGVQLRKLPRLERDGIPVSATTVRSLLEAGRREEVRNLVPETTYAFLESNNFLSTGG